MTLVLQMCVLPLLILYMVTLVVAYLGWVDIDLDVPPSCQAPLCQAKNSLTVEWPK